MKSDIGALSGDVKRILETSIWGVSVASDRGLWIGPHSLYGSAPIVL